jgi:hypothetical protein
MTDVTQKWKNGTVIPADFKRESYIRCPIKAFGHDNITLLSVVSVVRNMSE